MFQVRYSSGNVGSINTGAEQFGLEMVTTVVAVSCQWHVKLERTSVYGCVHCLPTPTKFHLLAKVIAGFWVDGAARRASNVTPF